jgi:hypothetical protein
VAQRSRPYSMIMGQTPLGLSVVPVYLPPADNILSASDELSEKD